MEMSETLPARAKKESSKKPTHNPKVAAFRRLNKRPVAKKPFVKIGVLVHDIARMRTTIFDQAVQEMGITCAQWWALANIARNKTAGMSQSDLARCLGVGKSATGLLLDRLAEKGMVARRPQDDDRRVNNIYITEHGFDLIHHMSPIAARLNALFLEGIRDEDIAATEAVLRKLHENLQMLCESGLNLKMPKGFKPKREAMR